MIIKKIFLIVYIFAFSLGASAIPAKSGIWSTLRLSNGTEVRAMLCGDEHVHYWKTEDGQIIVKQGDAYIRSTQEELRSRQVRSLRNHSIASSRSTDPKKVTPGKHTNYRGKKKGLVILAEFTDIKFQSGHDNSKYYKILNEKGYTTSEGFKGSVSDYFRDQSGGLFELDFDVFGPITLAHDYKYYGENDEEDYDIRPHEMIVEACKAVDSKANFKDYDWDDDGEADVVFVIYAGKAESDGGGDNTIWPHMYALEWMDVNLSLDGVRINTYACSNEIDSQKHIEGIGVICHEFSHCLGYTDLYDTINNTLFGMGSFDLMDEGSYNGNGFTPAGYSAYEKWMAGWMELKELSDHDVVVDNLRPISEGGEGYIIYNDGHPDEYYIIENRQKSKWDANLPDKGLMITHVDFDELLWELNIPNSILKKDDVYVKEYNYPTNDHPRFTIFHADNKVSSLQNDLYPYHKNDSLTATSTPSASFYNKNKQGKLFMSGAILDITQNKDSSMSFKYRAPSTETGIKELTTKGTAPAIIYDLQGRRLTNGQSTKGIYIINGKKIIR